VLIPLGFEDDPGRKRAADVTQAALKWVGTGTSRPFFLFLNYFDPHDPYLPPEPYRSKFSPRKNPGGRVNNLRDRYYPDLTPEQLQDEVDAYDGAIAYADHYIGEFIAGLEQRGLTEDTLIVSVSDHGESFGEHGLLGHFNGLYRDTLHVPMIWWWPGHLPAGARVAEPVSIAAVPATILDLLGEAGQEALPGPSLVPLWRDRDRAPSDQYPLAELAACPHEAVKKNPCYSGALQSLVSSQWHYIAHEKLGEELYDWQKDPQELNNHAETPEGQAAASDFNRRLRELLSSGKNSRGQR
jgi:arylsulfatase A-like enzyme